MRVPHKKLLSALVFILILLGLQWIISYIFYPPQETLYVAVKPSGYYLDGQVINLDNLVAEIKGSNIHSLHICIEHQVEDSVFNTITDRIKNLNLQGQGFTSAPTCK